MFADVGTRIVPERRSAMIRFDRLTWAAFSTGLSIAHGMLRGTPSWREFAKMCDIDLPMGFVARWEAKRVQREPTDRDDHASRNW